MGSSTRHLVLERIEQSIDVSADPSRAWAVVSDLPRMSEWSPQVWRSFVRDPGAGDGRVGPGARLLNVNRRGLLVWPTRSKVVRFEEGREIAWRIRENGAVWSFTLVPVGSGTRLVQRRDVPDGIHESSLRLTDRLLGGQPAFQAELQAGMRQTLARIKQTVEG